MAEFRSFRNSDPPGIAEIWNESLSGRGAVRLRHSSPLEHGVFAKPYFDPKGLIVAVEDGRLLGYVHVGFGPSTDLRGLAMDRAVISAIAVRPDHRRKGIGRQLLAQAESYAAKQGVTELMAGGGPSSSPFYFSLYGGSSTPGFLKTDSAAEPFFLSQGFAVAEKHLVMDRKLKTPVSVADGRFPTIRKKYEVRIRQCSGIKSWWAECAMGHIEMVEFRLEEKSNNEPAAVASVWEMDGFSWRWNQPSVGVLGVAVKESCRRQGMAKFLMGNLLKYLQEQYFELVECQIPESHEPSYQLLKLLGFEQVDQGQTYLKRLQIVPN